MKMNCIYFKITRLTTLEDLKYQKRELSKLHHPDKGGSDEAMSQILNEYELARELIETREKRFQKLVSIESKALAGITFLKPQFEPELKVATKAALIGMADFVPPRIKETWLKGVKKLSPYIDRADSEIIAKKLFAIGKHLLKH